MSVVPVPVFYTRPNAVDMLHSTTIHFFKRERNDINNIQRPPPHSKSHHHTKQEAMIREKETVS